MEPQSNYSTAQSTSRRRRRHRQKNSRSFTTSPSITLLTTPHFHVESRTDSLAQNPRRSVSPWYLGVSRKPELPDFVSKGPGLRKTYSVPTEIYDDNSDDIWLESHNRLERNPSNVFYPMVQTPSTSRKSSRSSSSCFSASSTIPTSALCRSSEDMVWKTPRSSFVMVPDDQESYASPAEENAVTLIPDYPHSTKTYVGSHIHELQGAAETIEALSRRSRRRISDFTASIPMSPSSGTSLPTAPMRKRSGITTRLGGQPRGVIQFLPSVKCSDMSRSLHESYMADKIRRQRLYSDRCDIDVDSEGEQSSYLSSTDTAYRQAFLNLPLTERRPRSAGSPSGRTQRRLSNTLEMHHPSYQQRVNMDSLRGMDTLDSVNRFSTLLRSLRSPDGRLMDPDGDVLRADSVMSSPEMSESSTTSDGHFGNHRGVLSDSDTSFLQADMLLWRRRSKGSIRKHQDTRTHIVRELMETENSYVENLKLLVHKYLRPLKRPELCSLIELSTLNEIFFQIPEMLAHHEAFLIALKSRLDFWDNQQKIGDIILNNFTKQAVIDTYTAFINNWKHARMAIRKACQAKPAFAKYLERCSREHMNKLTLDALLIMPVQRIPRYELLIKELLKHTSVEHADHGLLIRAGKEIHELASRIDEIQQETGFSDQMQQKLREIEAIVEGLDDLVSPERVFYRCDLVQIETVNGKKERCLFLFSDLILITTVTSRGGSTVAKSAQGTAPVVYRNFFESRKFKLLLKLSLQDLCIVDNNKQLIMKVKEEIANLQEDLRVAGKLNELTSLLKVDHKSVSKEVENLMDFIKVTLGSRHEELAKDPNLISLNLLVTTEFGNEPLLVTFKNTDNRLTWEKNFEEAKYAFAISQTKGPSPSFVKFIAASRTRSGFHFTCASASWPRNGVCEVWMCSSDQLSGQVYVLSLYPEVEVLNINSPCNSRIACICSIARRQSANGRKSKSVKTTKRSPQCPQGCSPVCQHVVLTSMDLDSDSSCEESLDGTRTASDSDKTNGSIPGEPQDRSIIDPKDELFFFTAWVGTESGCLQIYDRDQCNRGGKCKYETALPSSIRCMIYHDERIFVALGNGIIGYYECTEENDGHLGELRSLELEQKFAPISVMTVAANKLWCGSRNHVLVINLSSLKIERLFAINNDRQSSIGCLAASALAVWLSMYNSPVVKLYHATRCECLLEINIAPTVTKMLAGCDDIIRMHKLACLRITTMMCCKDTLWIGTSAGLLCYLSSPQVAHQTSKITKAPNVFCTNMGHMGPCRFLVSIDVPDYLMDYYTQSKRTKGFDLSRRRTSLNVASLQQKNVYVISGGEGLEDYHDSTNDDNDDSFGMEDSTNYLIIWKV